MKSAGLNTTWEVLRGAVAEGILDPDDPAGGIGRDAVETQRWASNVTAQSFEPVALVWLTRTGTNGVVPLGSAHWMGRTAGGVRLDFLSL